MDKVNVTTALELPGKKVINNLGLVRGITVRSRSVVANMGAGFQTIFGGKITLLTSLCEKTREESFDLMIEHAEKLGANAIVSLRYDTTEVMSGVTEVLCYGTAVITEDSK